MPTIDLLRRTQLLAAPVDLPRKAAAQWLISSGPVVFDQRIAPRARWRVAHAQ